MTVKDYGSTIMFFGDCVKYAELHYTGDYGRVLMVYPVALTQRRWTGIDCVRKAFQPDFEKIMSKYRIDKVSVAR